MRLYYKDMPQNILLYFYTTTKCYLKKYLTDRLVFIILIKIYFCLDNEYETIRY